MHSFIHGASIGPRAGRSEDGSEMSVLDAETN